MYILNNVYILYVYICDMCIQIYILHIDNIYIHLYTNTYKCTYRVAHKNVPIFLWQ